MLIFQWEVHLADTHTIQRGSDKFGQFSGADDAIYRLTQGGWVRTLGPDGKPYERMFFFKRGPEGTLLTAEVVALFRPRHIIELEG